MPPAHRSRGAFVTISRLTLHRRLSGAFGVLTLAILFLLPAANAWPTEQVLSGHVPVAAQRLASVGTLDRSKRLKLAIGLPLRNQQELSKFLRELSVPSSPNYRKYLTPAQFTERFGPAENDYQAVVQFAKAHGLVVTGTHPNRVILDVEAAVADIENAFHVAMRTYRHPIEARQFFAPDREPSLDLAVPVSNISGLNDYSLPHPHLKVKPAGLKANATPNSGSAPGGAYAGIDFRAAYVPGSTLTGSGQNVGLLEYDGYYAGDITAYTTQFSLPAMTLINVAVAGGVSSPGSGNGEVALDIEIVAAMAPGLSAIYVYEAPNGAPWVDLLNRMATDNLASQLSCSWGGGGPNAAAEAIFLQMAAQGQSFFNATGDSDAFTGSITFPSDSPSITQVGATTLTTSGSGSSYVSETVWNWGNGEGSSGGSSIYYSIPTWQQSVSMAANQGSTTMRNVPDVAMVGDNVYIRDNNGSSETVGGTSCAAPLWAALAALANQQGVTYGQPPLGFVNPAIYALGQSGTYASVFHDTTTGDNFSSASPSKFSAVAGYDLCTGLGTPEGNALINALVGLPLPVFTSALIITATSGVPFSYQITAGNNPLSFGATGLPTGLNVDTVTGIISGIPSTPGVFSPTISATNSNGTGLAGLSITILPSPPVITSPVAATANTGASFSYRIVASNNPTIFSAVGLPSGLTLDPSTGLISGTPTTFGTFSATIGAAFSYAIGSAEFNYPAGIAVNTGTIGIADTSNCTIRKMTSGGIVTPLAGSAGVAGTADGTGTAARYYNPYGIAMDNSGNLYIADTGNDTIRRITPGGGVTTLAGSAGIIGTADGTGSAARFYQPFALTVDGSGNLYVADTGNDTIRKVTPGKVVTTLAGSARVSGTIDGTGSAARFNQPAGIVFDGSGNLYVADSGNDTIRKISTSTGAVVTLAGRPGRTGTTNGTGNGARFYSPQGVAVDGSGNIYVADSGNDTVRKVTSSGVVTTLAGSPRISGSADGTSGVARFNSPHGLAIDASATLYVADSGNDTIRMVTSVGAVTTLAGVPGTSGAVDSPVSSGSATLIITVLPPAPPAPAGLTATAGNAQVALNWNPSSGSTSYNVKQSLDSGSGYTVIAHNIGAASYTDTSVTNGANYYYVVSAVNAGGESANSLEVSAFPSAPITSVETMPPAVVISGSDVQLTMASSVIGHTYQLQSTDSLSPSAWTNIGSPQSGTGSVLILQDPAGISGVAQRFYRIWIQQ